MATVKDVAAAVGVSVTTVSNVLNGRPNVGRRNRQKVLRATARLGYRPNRLAQAMRTGRTHAIGLVLPNITNPFGAELAQAVQSTARSLGLLVCLIDCHDDAQGEADGLALLTQYPVDGIIWCPLGPCTAPCLKGLTRPLVLIDQPHSGHAVVHSNYLMGGKLLVRHALTMGHRRVGLLSGPQNLATARQRRDGIVAACGVDIEIIWEVCVGFDGLLSRDAVDALRHCRDATLVVAVNERIAISAIRCLADSGISVPDDVSVTGFDNISWTAFARPRLTTIAQPFRAIGACAVELMQQHLAGGGLAPRRRVFDVALVERDSVKRLS